MDAIRSRLRLRPVLAAALFAGLAAAIAAAATTAAAPAAADDLHLVRDLDPGPGPGRSSFPELVATGGDFAYLFAEDTEHGREPWITDGTAAGTRRVLDVCRGPCSSSPGSPVLFAGRLFFLAGPMRARASRSGAATERPRAPRAWAFPPTRRGPTPTARSPSSASSPIAASCSSALPSG